MTIVSRSLTTFGMPMLGGGSSSSTFISRQSITVPGPAPNQPRQHIHALAALRMCVIDCK